MSQPPILPDDPEDTDATRAAEYVLRLLDPEADLACAAREAQDPAFAAEIARWRETFSTLDDAFAPIAPPAALRRRVETALFGQPPSLLRRAWTDVALWRWIAAAAVAGVVALGLTLIQPPDAPRPGAPRLVAAVQPVASDVSLVALYAPDSDRIEFSRVAGAAPAGRSLELWLLPPGETVPTSLGLVPDAPRFAATLPPEIASRVRAGGQILVSDEPAGGSPTGVATGPVVAAGPITEI